jgi:Phage protein Gp138 N-terminal domain
MMDGRQAAIWTSMPGIIESFNPLEMTAAVQPSTQARVQGSDGSFSWVTLPLLIHCPVQFPAGGGFTLTFPVAPGDECLVVFASRCIDAWWQSGGVQPQAELRMHDLSDGFVLLGFRSIPRVIANLSSSTTQLRSDDGSTYVEVRSDGKLKLVAPSGVDVVGDLRVTGEVLAKNGSTNIHTSTHTHPDPQGGDVGFPNPGS